MDLYEVPEERVIFVDEVTEYSSQAGEHLSRAGRGLRLQPDAPRSVWRNALDAFAAGCQVAGHDSAGD